MHPGRRLVGTSSSVKRFGRSCWSTAGIRITTLTSLRKEAANASGRVTTELAGFQVFREHPAGEAAHVVARCLQILATFGEPRRRHGFEHHTTDHAASECFSCSTGFLKCSSDARQLRV